MKQNFVRPLIVCSAVLSVSCLPGLADEVAPGEVKPSGWQSYGSSSDPFTMKYPIGWHLATDPKSGKIDVSDDSGAKLSVLPFASPTAIESAQAAMFFSGFMRSFSPSENWSKPELIGENAVRATTVGPTENACAVMVLSSSPRGTVGKLCVARLPKGASTVSSNTFAEMMASLQFHQKAQGQPPTQFAGYRLFSDPNENSFTVEVPVGWNVEGGMYRPVSIDARPWVKVVSPDNLMVAFIGDGKIPPFSMPTAVGYQLGYRIGSKYGGGEIRDYVPARRFVEQYARANLKKYISDIRIVEAHEHPDVALAVNGTVGATRSEASSIKFTGMYGNIPAVGYYLAATKATVQSGAGMWWVTLVAGELSPADRADGGLSVILHMIQTFKYNPVWKGQSVADAGEVSRQYTIASQAVSRSISDRYWSQQAANDANHAAYWGRQAVQDHAADNFSDYIRGTQNVQDPNSGNQYKVNYGPDYHWMDQGGNIMGTNDSAPGPGWHQLIAVP